MVEEKGKTLIPLSLYFKKGNVKVEFGLAQGKKLSNNPIRSILKKTNYKIINRNRKGKIITR